MSLTLFDIKERLKRYDEILVLEILEINAEELLDRFEDRIEEKAESLEESLNGE